MLKKLNINLNDLSQLLSKKIYTKKGYYICRKCYSPAWLFHLQNHQHFSDQENSALKGLKQSGIKGLVISLLSIEIIEEKNKIINGRLDKLNFIKKNDYLMIPIFKITKMA